VFVKKPYLAALAGAAVLVLAACGLSDPDSAQFAYQIQPLDAAPTPPAAAAVATDTGVVRVTGDASTPCVDQGVTMHGTRSGNNLQISLTRQSLNGCSGGTRWFSYTALMYLPKGGTYHVTFTDQTSGTSVTLIDKQVNVAD
jgi:hypothetical protein